MAEAADLSAFGMAALAGVARSMRELGPRADTVHRYAMLVCENLRQTLVDRDGVPQTVLARCYFSSRLDALPAADQACVADPARPLAGATQCLTLLGTAGSSPAWNDRLTSAGHRVIPLEDSGQVARLPMVAALLDQLGIDAGALTGSSNDVVLPTGADRYRIFHVPVAAGSPVIPAQDFVREWTVASAIGFGGVLASGEVFAVVLFTRVSVPATTARLFGAVALSMGLALHELLDVPLLPGSDPAKRPGGGDGTARRKLAAELALELVDVHERLASGEAERAALAIEAATYAAGRAGALSAVALQLSGVTTVAGLMEIIIGDGLGVLLADGGSLALVNDDRTSVRVEVSRSFSDVSAKYATLALDDALPTTLTARTGEPVLVPDIATGLARFPALAGVFADIPVQALASVALRVGGTLIGALTVTWTQPQTFTPDMLGLLHGLAAQAAQAMQRMTLANAERAAHEALQRSLLELPPSAPGLQIAVRYLPSSVDAQIGGDWYDVIQTPDGATLVSVGDVVGHDMQAAAVMGQLRNLLRGIALTAPASPADTLTALDRAVEVLAITATATVVLLAVRPGEESNGTGRVVTWSNAGHPPPIYLAPDGQARLLRETPDLLVGVDVATVRASHTFRLEPGGTVLLYTDGLVERRGEDIDRGLNRLAAVAGELAGHRVDDLCNELLTRMVMRPEDDIAIVALRLR